MSEQATVPIEIFIISDAIGETAHRNVAAVLAQFPHVSTLQVKKFSFVTTPQELQLLLDDARKLNAIVVTTLVKKGLNAIVAKYQATTDLQIINYMQPFMQWIEQRTGMPALEQASAQYLLNPDYFKRIEAIEFAVKYDDGRDPKGFAEADCVILGISRTSKTPVSMYLANRGLKVANLPLIPEIPVPRELYDVPATKLIGLLSSSETVQQFRSARLKEFGVEQRVSYADFERIEAEIAFAKRIFRQTGAKVLTITNVAIEETAQKIEAFLLQHRA